MVTYSLCIIDDDDELRNGMVAALEESYLVDAYSTAEAAMEEMENRPPDLVLLDIGLPGMDGLEALRRIKQFRSDSLVIMITAFEDLDTVVTAMKSGAYDYLIKPLYMDTLALSIGKALQTIALKKELQTLQEKCLEEHFPCFIGESKEIRDVMDFVKKVARSPDTPVLILGETGTGKELIASAIHLNSPNFNSTMVTLNCAAIPRDLVESELFGYEQGAFSGARSGGKKGLIEEAANGTFFLDEVGDLCLEAQAKLLRFLEDGQYYRVGGTKLRKIHTRIISATNKDLEAMVKEGLFREDLYYRLGTIKIELPSLNRRPEDIVPLARQFLVEFSDKFGKILTGICPETERALMDFRWAGNIRELRNVIERGALVGKGPLLTIEDLGIPGKQKIIDCREGVSALKEQTKTDWPAKEREEKRADHCRKDQEAFELPPLGVDLTAILESIEKGYIEKALEKAGGNECKAARLLGLNHHTFRYRRKKLRILSPVIPA